MIFIYFDKQEKKSIQTNDIRSYHAKKEKKRKKYYYSIKLFYIIIIIIKLRIDEHDDQVM